jgi:hypothetical protein
MGMCHSLEIKNLVYYFIGFYVLLFLFSTPVTTTTTTKRESGYGSGRSEKMVRVEWLKNEIKLLQDELKEIEDDLLMMEPSAIKTWIRDEIRDEIRGQLRSRRKPEVDLSDSKSV